MFALLRYVKALKDNRSLIMNFAIGDLKNRYKNSVLGFLWNIVEPLILLSVLYFVFSSMLKVAIPNFAIFILLGIITWRFITHSTTLGIDSISSRSSIISHVYFMRAIPALSSNITALMMLGLEYIILSFFLIGFGVIPTETIVFLPYYIFLIFLMTLGLSLALSVLSIVFKDIKFIWNLALTAGFFMHPIIYTRQLLSEEIKEILAYLPSVQIFYMIHDSVLYDTYPILSDIVYVTVWSFAILGVGYLIYKKLSPRIVEEL